MSKVHICKTSLYTHHEGGEIVEKKRYVHSCLRGFIDSIVNESIGEYPCQYAVNTVGGGCDAPNVFKKEYEVFDYKRFVKEKEKISSYMPNNVELEGYSKAYKLAIIQFYKNQNFDIKSICIAYCNVLFIENKYDEQRTLQIAESEIYNIIEHFQRVRGLVESIGRESTEKEEIHNVLSKTASEILSKFMPKDDDDLEDSDVKTIFESKTLKIDKELNSDKENKKTINPFAHLMPED
jgi:hypothetical protein